MSETVDLACGTLGEMAPGPPAELTLCERVSISSFHSAVSTDEVAAVRLGPVVVVSGHMSESLR